MDTKWRTLNSKTLIQDRWINVRADRCITPSGTEISPYYVLTYPDWVHVVALTPQRGLVLVRQYRHAVGVSFLELPAGAIEAEDDDVEKAAHRELAEETGFTSKCWIKISTLYSNPATHTNRVHTFLALDAVAQYQQKLDQGEEGLDYCVMPLDDILQGLETGILGQSMHVASVLLAARVIQSL